MCNILRLYEWLLVPQLGAKDDVVVRIVCIPLDDLARVTCGDVCKSKQHEGANQLAGLWYFYPLMVDEEVGIEGWEWE